MDQALAGLQILDLTHYIAGPYCTRILAGFGAEVIKVEKPGEGDKARHIGPFLNDEPGPERSGLFLYLNSNKKGITLNLKSRRGVEIFKELVKGADAVVESFKPGVMDRLGLDYSTLERINPRLVMTSISNFGQTGPYRDYKSPHIITWGMSGGRYTDGEPGKPPVQGGGSLSEYVAGVFGAGGTAMALFQGNETSIGQHVDVSIFECMMLIAQYPSVMYSYWGQVHGGLAKNLLGIFSCKDGYIGVNFLTQLQWESICAFFGSPEVANEPKFRYPVLTVNEDYLDEARTLFAPKIAEYRKMDLFQSAVEWRIPFGLVPTTQEIVDSPQHKARGFFEEVDHPVMGKVTMPGAPFKMMETTWQLRSPAPLLGEHNQEIYGDRLGYSREDLVRFREQGII